MATERGDHAHLSMVAMKPVVEGMGLDWSAQFVKIKAHPVLAPAVGQITTVGGYGFPRRRLRFVGD